MTNRKPVIVVEGGQWGSEAKGAVAAHLCISRAIDYVVRTGAINAGHTVVYKDKAYAMQQLPTGWVNPNTQLVIGAGAYIHPPTLWREIDMVNAAMPESDVRKRLWIDYRCGIHDEGAEAASKGANRHHSIGATGKGCSEAIVAKIQKRNNGYELFANTQFGKDFWMRNDGRFVDTVSMLNTAIDRGERVLIEGTQGTLLDLHLGPYPFTTSRMTSAANWVAECGLSPSLDYEVVLVCRTYPIRVAGNSGPMDNEIEWLALADTINAKRLSAGLPPKVDPMALEDFRDKLVAAAVSAVNSDRYMLPRWWGNSGSTRDAWNVAASTWTTAERSLYRVAASELNRDALNLCSNETVTELRKLFEITTVTKKLRRISRLSMDDLRFAVQVNRPSWICMTFMDYEEPLLANFTGEEVGNAESGSQLEAARMRAAQYIGDIERVLGVPIHMVTVGPKHEHMFSTNRIRERMSER